MNTLITERNLPSGRDLFAAMRAKFFEARETEAAALAAEDADEADSLYRDFDLLTDELLELLWALEVGGHLEAIARLTRTVDGGEAA